MSNTFHNKVIVVTGAGSGIGAATAKLLASRGAKVSITDVQERGLDETVKAIEEAAGSVISAVLDVRDRTQVEAWISQTVSAFGKLDGAANLAGVTGKQTGFAQVQEIDDNDWDLMFNVNVKGMLNCLRAEIKVMNDGGSIVDASSVAGIRGIENSATYCATKHAVIGLTRTVAKEQAGRGIRANALAPGAIDTPLLRASIDSHPVLSGSEDSRWAQVPLKRVGQPTETAELISFFLSDASKYITGTVSVIDGGMMI